LVTFPEYFVWNRGSSVVGLATNEEITEKGGVEVGPGLIDPVELNAEPVRVTYSMIDDEYLVTEVGTVAEELVPVESAEGLPDRVTYSIIDEEYLVTLAKENVDVTVAVPG
jgi:hypothetical protein